MAAKKKAESRIPKGSVIDELDRNPDEKNWALFEKQMKKDGARYYFIHFPSGVKEKDDLTRAYAVIYNAKQEELYKVPIVKRVGKGIEGATIHMK